MTQPKEGLRERFRQTLRGIGRSQNLLGAKAATKVSKFTQRLGQFLRWARLRSSNSCFMPVASASLALHCLFQGPVAVYMLATAQELTPVDVAELLV
jgi:hypothetical protein